MRWIEEVFLNFRRSGFMTLVSIGTIIITIATLGGYYIINESVDYFAQRIEKKVEVVAFMKDSAGREVTDNMVAELQSFGPVAEARYISKEDALRDFTKDPEMKAVLDGFPSNPLPDSVVIRLSNYSETAVNEVLNFVRSKEGVEEVQYGAAEIKNLISILNVVRIIALAAGLIFFISGLIVVANVIGLTIYARRQDIYIFRMIGASESYVRMPFILEGIIHGLIGGILGWGVLYLISQVLIYEIRRQAGVDLTRFYLFSPMYFSVKFLIMSVAAGSGLGFLGALFSQGRIGK